MLKGIFAFRKRWTLVNEFANLQSGQPARELVFRPRSYPPHQAEWKFFADHSQRLEQLFFGRRELIDASGQNALHGRRNLYSAQRLGHTHASIARENSLVEQGAYHFLH